MTRRFHAAAWLCCLLLTLGVAACGSDDKPKVTPTPTGPAGPTVGALADQIAAAWPAVKRYRTDSRGKGGIVPGFATPGAPAAPQTIEVVTEIVVPDQKHQVTKVNGLVQEEYIVVGGKIYGRGPLAETMPGTPVAGAWRVVDPSTINPQSPQATPVAALIAPAKPPYSGLSADERERDAKPIGTVTVDDRTCQAYQIADTTQTGERIDVTLAIGPDHLPCSIETKAGGTDYVTTYTFNGALTITPPALIATPSGG